MKKLFVIGIILASTLAYAKDIKETVKLEVTENGFVPNSVNVKPGTDVTLAITRKTDSTCATAIQIPDKKIKKIDLPLNKTITIAVGKLEKGEIRFGCGMNMMTGGKIIVN